MSDTFTKYAYEETLGDTDKLIQQLANSQKREAMLRDVIQHILSGSLSLPRFARDDAEKALAATADLENVRLCEKEQVGLLHVSVSKDSPQTSIEYAGNSMEPLYRAWEPKK